MSLNKFTESYNAYNAAYRIKKDKSTNDKMEVAISRMSTSSSTSSSSRSSSSTSSSTSSANEHFHSASSALGKAVQKYGSLGLLISFVLYLIPFVGAGITITAWRFFCICSLLTRACSLLSKYGMPRLHSDYAQSLLSAPLTPYFFLSVLLLSSRPYFLPGLSLVLTEVMIRLHLKKN